MLSATVVVSCYNQERYIVECLDSILSQEINFECEVIVSDDCSTDRTQEVLLEYSRLHEGRLKLYKKKYKIKESIILLNQ